jgi:DHA2 family lincomycin resistance protein-like MFS transporter
VGFALIVVGQAIVCLVSRNASIAPVVAAAVLVYAGVGLVMSPTQTAGLKHLPPALNPFGVAIMNTFIQVAASFGPSLFVGILSSTAASAAGAGATAALAQAQGFSVAVLVAAVIAVCGLAISLAYARGAVRAAAPADRRAIPGEPSLADVMKTDVYQVMQTATVHDAVALMLEKHTSGLPITNASGEVVGYISDGDVMKALGRQGAAAVDLVGALAVYHEDETFEQRLAEVMEAPVMEYATRQVISLDASSSIEAACTVLGEGRLKKVPVLSEGRLVGTVSRSDVNRHLMATFVKLGELAHAGADPAARWEGAEA